MDELATIGAPMFNEELIVKILKDLGSIYKISTTIKARNSTISYENFKKNGLTMRPFYNIKT
ncbi:hypothetical protein PVK06_019453 [Gossypium arboreum]|uniref:Uncharacterized protein n=1 Tax=Gossypium arboreum TaxID=29729 RepID=A0ABR0PJS9_GOSAR|nr:hypothetical protein PVK06_019453 [Gossypium arboreum]